MSRLCASEMDICYVMDDNFAKPTAVSINSMLRNSEPDDKFNIHVVDLGITDEHKSQLEKLKITKDFNIDFTKFDISVFRDLRNYSCGKSVYIRYMFYELFPNINKLIYIDGDTVVKGSLKDMWNIDMTNYYWSGIPHFFGSIDTHCCGVMLLNLEKFREDKLKDPLLSITRENQPRRYFTEEYAMGAICKGHIYELPLKYNMHVSSLNKKSRLVHRWKDQLLEESKETVIWHYAQRLKPWKISRESFMDDEKYDGDIWDTWWDEFNLLPFGWE